MRAGAIPVAHASSGQSVPDSISEPDPKPDPDPDVFAVSHPATGRMS